jgi:hypothetical protein
LGRNPVGIPTGLGRCQGSSEAVVPNASRLYFASNRDSFTHSESRLSLSGTRSRASVTIMKCRTGLDRSQTLLFPESLEDYVASENPMRSLTPSLPAWISSRGRRRRVREARRRRRADHEAVSRRRRSWNIERRSVFDTQLTTNRRHRFPFAMHSRFDYCFCAPPSLPAAAGERRR